MPWFGVLIPVVAIIAVFVFVAVASWSDNRRMEREAFYRHETYRKMLEQPGQGGHLRPCYRAPADSIGADGRA